MACATSDLRSSRGLSLDSDPQDKIRLVFYLLTVGDLNDSTLEKVGEWCVEGCVEGISLYKDRKGLFYHGRC